MVYDVAVIGAGAAGLMAASHLAELGCRTVLLEKNRKPGVKILMSGGTRCNLTHHTDARGIIAAFGKPGRFRSLAQKSDLNNDGTVNHEDMFILGQHWQETSVGKLENE